MDYIINLLLYGDKRYYVVNDKLHNKFDPAVAYYVCEALKYHYKYDPPEYWLDHVYYGNCNDYTDKTWIKFCKLKVFNEIF